ncbi:MAG: hypothetical protein CSA95_09290 [Bacteroidetes bacterium]|nr:MAG: hypothetical protein CSA95_09290 [Bacteroidota bacterium]
MQSVIEWLNRNGRILNRIIWFVMSTAILVFLFPKEGKFKYSFQQGRPWLHQNLIAPYDFPIYKTTAERENEKSSILAEYTPIFEYKEEITKHAISTFRSSYYTKITTLPPSQHKDSILLREEEKQLEKVLHEILTTGIIERVSVIEKGTFSGNVLLKKGNEAVLRPVTSFFTITQARDQLYSSLAQREDGQEFIPLLVNNLAQNIIYNKEASEYTMDEALNKISPTRGMVQKGERIISRGDLITPKSYQILNSLKIEHEKRTIDKRDRNQLLLGQILLATILMLTLFGFLFFFKRTLFMEGKDFLLILLTLFMMVGITSLVLNIQPEYIYVIPLCLVPIILRVFYDHEVALFTLFMVLLILGFLVPNTLEYFFLHLITGITAIISITSLLRRSQFIRTSIIVMMTYSVSYFTLQLIQGTPIGEIDYAVLLQFLINGALLSLSFPIIFFYEKLFRKVTDITLMELADTNNRLLRLLADEAPGTFHHSIMVANLAEEAVRAVGGNSLLVRAGALYHDIGKLNDPHFFVENQIGNVSPHDELSYEESARIIKSHVSDGVTRARRYKLPDQVIDFIRTHHGTSKIGYFYAMAQRESGEVPPDEKLYTYPGPAPFSKETCILMMSDAVEAASRTLKNPTDTSINDLVEKIIDKQIALKQYENANITYKDITTVKSVLKRKLKNVYHVRIDYPAEALR